MEKFLIKLSDDLCIEVESDENEGIKRQNLSPKETNETKTINKIDSYTSALGIFANQLASSFTQNENKPDEVEIQFGVVLKLDAQVPFKLLSSSSSANLNVKLKWKNK